jgi:EAL domain-containing protein (putative c-di-GMP-specific phosphodiesterase class I)
MVFNALAVAGLAPHRLEIEITESALLDNSETTLDILRQLHDFGVRIAMDDFGTGYSSLSYLRTFPFDKIKIDRCFVADLSKGGENAVAIIRAISALGRALNLTVTAEGVETQEQLDKIRAEGCTEMQGYLFSKPQPAVELRRFFGPLADKAAAVERDVAA